MKKRLHDKKAGLVLLSVLLVLSVTEVVFRLGCMRENLLSTSNAGVPLATAIFAVMIMIFTLRGKHRICYICYGAWLACFVLDQAFGLPGMIGNLVVNFSDPGMTTSIVLRLLTMICIVGIGALLVEYMNDGTIYNRAFNALCLITVLLLAADIIMGILGVAFAPSESVVHLRLKKQLMLVVFNNIYRLSMVFLCTFFAYDSAKMHLKKTDLAK